MNITKATMITCGAALALGATMLTLPAASAPSGAIERVAHQPQNLDIGQILFEGLANSEGCLKVMGADTSEGHNVIIAWFENKEAVETWYYSQTHTRVMKMVGSDPSHKKPMARVDDDDITVMVMASITFGGEQVIPGPMPVSQISIELYTPLDAGASVNGRLMPESIQLEHFRTIDAIDSDG